jgi:4-amino-4-deoxy-L-arabinose transferase-like glycosyltransferase
LLSSTLETAGGRRWILPGALLSIFAIQSLWFIATQSLTYDEPAHITAGSEIWRYGRFQRWNDHPPLGRLWLTLPIATTPLDFEVQLSTRNFLFTKLQPGPEWLSWRTRPMNTILGLLLGVTLWFATRRIFSEGAANVALALFAFTPSLIAHFSVATTDGIGTLFILLVAIQLVRWRHQRTTRQAVLMGFALGGLLLSKFYAPPLVLMALALMFVVSPDDRAWTVRKWNWRPALFAALIAVVVVWAGYLFHVSRLQVGEGHVRASFPNRPVRDWPSNTKVHLTAIIPAGEFVEGLREVARNNHHGRPAWFLGKLYPDGGILAYYPTAMLLKWPTLMLACVLSSLAFGVRKTSRSPRDLLLLCLFPLVFLAFALNSKYNIGERHILPIYPFALMIAGGLWEHARKTRLTKALLIAALCLNALDALRCAPDYLAYFNILVKPQNSWRLLTDSNLDWGQGLIALREYQRQAGDASLQLAYFGSVDPALYGIRAVPIREGDQPSEKIIVSPTSLSGQMLDNSDAFQWLWPYQPVRVIDHALRVYELR